MIERSVPRFRRAILAALAAATIAASIFPAPAQDTRPPVPDSMASLGDSISRAYNACGFFADCPVRSWSTGTDPAVESHYQRIKAINDALTAHNDSRSGARANELGVQAQAAVSQGVDYVTILVGANDACARSESEMTSVADFEGQIRAAIETLNENLPEVALFVSSVPDLEALWRAGKDHPEARRAWDAFNICQSMLANPTSTDPADEARRDRVRQRVIDYNRALESVCRDHPRCKFDDNAVFSSEITLDHLSTWDYFHPNTHGQNVLAQLTYEHGFDWKREDPVDRRGLALVGVVNGAS